MSDTVSVCQAIFLLKPPGNRNLLHAKVFLRSSPRMSDKQFQFHDPLKTDKLLIIFGSITFNLIDVYNYNAHKSIKYSIFCLILMAY